MNEVILFEELSMNAHPSIKTLVYDGWILRFANGYTYRANSVNPLYSWELPIEEKIERCEKLYKCEGLPAVYKLTPLSDKRLDSMLEARGYQVVTPTHIMTKELEQEQNIDSRVIIEEAFSEKWQEGYFSLNNVKEEWKIEAAKAIRAITMNKILCVSIIENEKMIACGSGIIEGKYIGLYDITVDEVDRKKGLGFIICSALLSKAYSMGVRTAYLQVVSNNIPAIKLYQKLGFKDCYEYWYRVQQNNESK